MTISERAEASVGAPAGRRFVRGMLLGLVVGDAVGAAHGQLPDGAAPLRNTVGAQLACVTTEGLIRASVRQGSKGICHPPSVVWHALVRWGHGQGIPADRAYAEWQAGAQPWPDGWLAQVPLLSQRRGDAPATVRALTGGHPGTAENPTTISAGSHALLRALPVAALDRPPEDLRSLAAEVAAQTHGAPDGFLAAADIVLVAAACLEGDDVVSACRAGLAAARRADPASPRLAALAAAAAPDPQPQARRLAVLARDRTAPATATAALYVACSFPRPDQLADALRFAAQAPPQVAAITGALLGAVHGPDALPVDALSRCELVWVTDTLARDLVTELTESPAGQETLKPTGPGQYDLAWEQRSEPSWWSRYPGW